MPTRVYRSRALTIEEQCTILTLAAKGMGCTTIAEQIQRDESTVSKFLARMQDTSKLAQATLRAGSLILAKRVIKQADVKESIDVLSRPDIGALAPPTPKGGSGGFGIQVSVGVMSNGTVVKIEGGTIGQLPEGGSTAAKIEANAQTIEVPRVEG